MNTDVGEEGLSLSVWHKSNIYVIYVIYVNFAIFVQINTFSDSIVFAKCANCIFLLKVLILLFDRI